MRVLHVITDLGLGGAEVMLHRLLEATAPGCGSSEVVSLTDLGVVAERIERLGVRIRAIGMTRIPNPVRLLRLRRVVEEVRPDVVQTWMYHADLLGGVAARWAGGCRVVWGIHNNALDPVAHRTTRLAVALGARLSRRVPDAIVCVSSAARDLHVGLGYAPEKMVVLPNGFDLARFRPDEADRRDVRRELGVGDETVLVGLVARVDPQKAHGTFVRAAGLLARRRPDVRFLLCGAGTTRANEALVAAIRHEQVLDRFLLLGQRTDVHRVMNALDVGTLSSTSEAFPLVVGECMACGVPCVVTDVGDCRLLVGDTGLVVPARSPEALARAWEELAAAGPEARRRRGRAARDRIAARFDIASVAAEYAGLYERLLAGGEGLSRA